MPTPTSLRQTYPTLWYHLLVLLHDLHSFASSPPSRTRLDSVTDATYISPPYFTDAECALLKSTPVTIINDDEDGINTTQETTLEVAIQASMARLVRKMGASGDFRPCAAHDLVPMFERLLGVGKEEWKDERFLARLGRQGLGSSNVEENRSSDRKMQAGGKKEKKGLKGRSAKG